MTSFLLLQMERKSRYILYCDRSETRTCCPEGCGLPTRERTPNSLRSPSLLHRRRLRPPAYGSPTGKPDKRKQRTQKNTIANNKARFKDPACLYSNSPNLHSPSSTNNKPELNAPTRLYSNSPNLHSPSSISSTTFPSAHVASTSSPPLPPLFPHS
jgi:hypothetical protein